MFVRQMNRRFVDFRLVCVRGVARNRAQPARCQRSLPGCGTHPRFSHPQPEPHSVFVNHDVDVDELATRATPTALTPPPRSDPRPHFGRGRRDAQAMSPLGGLALLRLGEQLDGALDHLRHPKSIEEIEGDRRRADKVSKQAQIREQRRRRTRDAHVDL
eukprot:6173748-Prymnesium_polylepis.1